MPKELDFTSIALSKWEDELDEPVNLDAMHSIEFALGKVSLPLKARFVPVDTVHVQFNRGSKEDHTIGGFVILDIDVVEFIQAG